MRSACSWAPHGAPSGAGGLAPGEVPLVRPSRDAREQPPAGRRAGRDEVHQAGAGDRAGLVAELPGGAWIYAVPGVPEEMVEMMEGTILPSSPRRRARAWSAPASCGARGSASRRSRSGSMIFSGSANPTIAFLASSGEVKASVAAKAATAGEADELIQPVAEEVRRGWATRCSRRRTSRWSRRWSGCRRLRARRSRAPSRSRAGASGPDSASVPGASEVFVGSAVVYRERREIGVVASTPGNARRPGPVSEECAREMAAGARRGVRVGPRAGVDGSGRPRVARGAPPGVIWIALDGDDVAHARGFQVPGERDRVRRWAEQAALDLVRRYLEGRPLPGSDRVI